MNKFVECEYVLSKYWNECGCEYEYEYVYVCCKLYEYYEYLINGSL